MVALLKGPAIVPAEPDILPLVSAVFAARTEYNAATRARQAHERDSTRRQLLAWHTARSAERALIAARRTDEDWRNATAYARRLLTNTYRNSDPIALDAAREAYWFCADGHCQAGLYGYRDSFNSVGGNVK